MGALELEATGDDREVFESWAAVASKSTYERERGRARALGAAAKMVTNMSRWVTNPA
jgi:hypothetical protein